MTNKCDRRVGSGDDDDDNDSDDFCPYREGSVLVRIYSGRYSLRMCVGEKSRAEW